MVGQTDLPTEGLLVEQIGLYNFFGEHPVNWPGFMAASLVVLEPVAVLFFFRQKMFIQGITLTGLKG